MKIYIETDLEGVAGVRDFAEWAFSDRPYYHVARELLTLEVNAAVDGFFSAGATEILVDDGHGPGGIDITVLDPRVELSRGWKRWPRGMDEGFDAFAVVGQHAKSRTPLSNMAHTQSLVYLELSVNGIAIGEFGQLAMCASELGVRTIFATGEQAFAEEARALVPGIETVAVKRGTIPGRGDECTAEAYTNRNYGAVHMHPEKARGLIREGAVRALERAGKEDFGILDLTPPFRRVAVYRGTKDNPQRTFSVAEHPSSVVGVMNMQTERKPVESEEQLRELLVD